MDAVGPQRRDHAAGVPGGPRTQAATKSATPANEGCHQRHTRQDDALTGPLEARQVSHRWRPTGGAPATASEVPRRPASKTGAVA